MNIQFIGTDAGYQIFKVALMNKAHITTGGEGANVLVYEIASIDDLYRTPKNFRVPAFFYITTKDKAISNRIREYPVSGLIFPPINADGIMAKLRHVSESNLAKSPDSYDTIQIKILAKAENIPPMPVLAQQLISLTRSDSSTIADITSKIKMDQGISSKVIKLVNSPFFGIRQEITSIDRATVLLGFNSVKNIAAAISLSQFYKKPFNMYKTTGQAVWAHSYKTACIAQYIGKIMGLDEDSAYLAGLLHDIGKILMVDFLVKETSYPEEERAQLGFDHSEVGSIILKKWSIAPNIVEAVKNHHKIVPSPMSKALYYANKIDGDHAGAEDIIEEMAFTVGVQDTELLKNKIIPFITDFNVDI